MLLNEFAKYIESLPNTSTFPAIFMGHGNPMNAIEDNQYTKAWIELGKTLPKPKVILSISAHWFTEGTFVHVSKKPKTIHDFWGFPKALFDVRYPCPGSPEYAKATQLFAKKVSIISDSDWGIDHGTWSVLCRMYPNADIPVYQMSIDLTKCGQWHYELAKQLSPLRDKGVLIMGSGNIVHNLGRINWDAQAKPYDWALEFDEQSRQLIENGDHRGLYEYEKLGHAAKLSIPTTDHYWPLIYTLGMQRKNESVSFPVEGIAFSSVGMRCLIIK